MSAADIDARLGRVIRQRRLTLGLSLEALGSAIGVTYQQLQKYEKGVNQVSFSRLVDLANALRTTVGDLARDAQLDRNLEPGEASDREVMELMKRFSALPENQRLGVRLLVRNLAGETL